MRAPRNIQALILAGSAAVAAAACGGPELAGERPSLEAERLAAHTRFLSHDLLEGRAPGTRGEALATEYIATQFALAGARPAGDGGGYFQSVPLVGVETLPETRMSWRRGGRQRALRYLDEFVAVNQRQQPEIALDAELVFVGHGIVAPEFEWDDYKGADVQGKVAVLFTNEPPSEDPDFFGGKALTYYGRWSFKYEEALRQGAAGVLIIHTSPTAGYPWEVVRNSWSGRNPFLPVPEGETALALAGWLRGGAGAELVGETGKSLDELLEASHQREFEPIPLEARLSAVIHSEVEPFETRNVLAAIEGSDPARRSEAIVYTAHWDHLGSRGGGEGDAIYNGAVDNATGCAVLLELARAFGKLSPPPARSILFLATGAEEGGLRGSQYYAQNPVFPPGKTALALNYDGLFPLGKLRDFTPLGYERTTVNDLAGRTARDMGLRILPDPLPEQGLFYRSDHFSLAKVGIPALFVRQGVHYEGRSREWAIRQVEDYISQHYHQPSDEFNPEWDFRGLAQLGDFGLVLGMRVAQLEQLPSWRPGDEFLAAREASWAEGE